MPEVSFPRYNLQQKNAWQSRDTACRGRGPIALFPHDIDRSSSIVINRIHYRVSLNTALLPDKGDGVKS